MPNSSRRKQAKPQHLHNKEDEDQDGTGNHNVTSTQSPGDQPSQESQHGSTVTGKDTNGSKVTGETDTFSENSGDDEIIVERNGEIETVSEKTYLRINLKDSTYNNDSLDAIDFEDRGASAPMFTPPSPQVANRFCVYCNVVKKSPADLERHLRKHTGDRPFGCRGCEKSFKSKRSLQYHQYMNHGIEDADSNIAQRYGILRKRRLEETQLRSDYTHYLQEPVNFLNEKGATNPLNYSMQPTHQSPVAIPQDMVSKKMRLDNFPTSQPQYNSAINSSLDTNSVDLSIARAAEPGLQSGPIESMDGSQDLSRACPVCTKVFPKPSDLKRHMMCHTGEKPFKCEFCGKPFRAKSSMHYHLKAAHGLDIELSPGLEERYLRMKTRAHMNSLHRSQYSGLGIQQSSDTASEVSYYRDVDELEDEIRSNDSTDMKNPGCMHDFRQGTSSSNSINEKTSRIDGATFPGQPGSYEGVVIAAAEPFRRNQISVQNETVLVTRLDGLDMINGKTASIYKCYLCGKMFNSLSGIQCHLSLHFDKQLVSFECCFCDEIFSLKTQMRNHIRKKHSSHLRRKVGKDDSSIFDDKGNKSSVFSKSLAAKLEESKRKSKKHITCKYCRKIFLNSKSLQKHMKYHFWNRNCFCRMCGKTFTQYKSLQLHISRFHWTVASNASISSHNLHQRLNFFKTFSHPANKNGMIKGKVEIKKQTDVDQIKDVTVVLPQSPSDNDELSDDVTSHHSSDNWPEHSTENGSHLIDNQSSIKVAPKRSLMSYRRENMNGKPQNKSPRKINNDMNDYPVNFVKTEPGSQDTNNNESSHESRSGLSPDYKPNISSPDSMLPSPYMNATNHLLLAKALAAHNVSQLSQNTMNTSTPYFPPTTLPPNLAAMSHMMSLPMSVQDPNGPQTSKSPSPASLSSSKSDQSPEDREKEKELLVGYPRVQWGQKGSADKLWNFNMFQPDGNLSSDGRKVTSLSRTHSRLPIVHSPINREAMCKPTTTPDGRTLYKCPFCSKDFLSFSDINRHMDFHEDIRPYKCQYCDYYARTNSQLKVHMMRHQGIREFCCKLCNYKGVTQSDLNRHMKSQIHMLKSRNACQHCGEGFVTSKNLEKHLDGNCIVKMQKLNGDLNLPLQESIA